LVLSALFIIATAVVSFPDVKGEFEKHGCKRKHKHNSGPANCWCQWRVATLAARVARIMRFRLRGRERTSAGIELENSEFCTRNTKI